MKATARPEDHFEAHGDPEPHSADLRSYLEMVEQPKGSWLITNVLPARSSVVLFGGSNTFKSFLLYDMLLSVCTGRRWHDYEVTNGNVIIIASEGRIAVGNKRIPAWMTHHKIPLAERRGIFLHKAAPHLNDDKELQRLMDAIASVAPVAAIAYDVQRDTMLGAEKDETISNWIAAREKIQQEFECTQISITHSPFSDTGRARGPTELWGSFDTRLKAEGDKEARTTVLSVDRHKDFDSLGLEWGFRLEVVKIDDGACKGETSLVPVLDGTIIARKEKGPKLTGGASETLKAFRYAIAEGAGKHVVDNEHIPPSILTLTEFLWRIYFDKIAAGQKPDAKRKSFDRGIKRLAEIGLIAKWDEFHWLTPAGEAAA